MSLSRIAICYILLLICTGAKQGGPLPRSFRAKVVAVKDGDTIQLLYNNNTITIRLAHIDCPELKHRQPFGRAAKEFTSAMCFGKIVTVEHDGKTDRYKRTIAVIINDKKENVNKSLVRAGLAWHFTRYSADTSYRNLEANARKNKTGLWAGDNPVAPWKWRTPKNNNSRRGKKLTI